LAGDIAIQYIGGGRYCNKYIDWLHILQYNILVVADIAMNILIAEDIAIQYIACHITRPLPMWHFGFNMALVPY
jgi:hypothetical protein